MERLRDELATYYGRLQLRGEEPAPTCQIRANIADEMAAFVAAHPESPAVLLKAYLHERIAERFQPMVFRYSPFFFEMGLRPAENWGTPWPTSRCIGAWLLGQREPAALKTPLARQIAALSGAHGGLGLWNGPLLGFDADHHTLGYSRLLHVGVLGILEAIRARRARPHTTEQAVTWEAMERSAHAVLRVAQRFAETARAMLDKETDPIAHQNLTAITAAAARVPAHPPQTFYEGLASVWFLREATATMEAIGVSVLGHLDRQLIDLYQADLAAGRLTEEEARDLIARWMLPTDVKFHVRESAWPETSTCLELGGCDAAGRPVWNELTRLFIEVHRDQGLISPKLNCRYGASSPDPYLDLISETILAGHNHFALLNDDVLISACQRAGKTLEEARLYVNGGCQETIVEGVEHSAGAYYYVNMPRVLELCLAPAALPEGAPVETASALPQRVVEDSFEGFLTRVLEELKRTIAVGAAWRAAIGQGWRELHPCPFFSTTLEGCIDQGADYTAGGAKYNPSGIALVGLGTLVDALYALRIAVFDESWLSLETLTHCLATNWRDNEALRLRLERLPRYGQGHPQVDSLAQHIAHDLAAHVRTLPNERGGYFQPSLFVYYAFSDFGKLTGATPDGRYAGAPLSQGIGPDRRTSLAGPTNVLHSIAALDLTEHPGNAVLDLQLPAGQPSPQALRALIRTFARLGGATLQPNCVSAETLRAAQREPEAHSQLVVRICGLSAYFVALKRKVQEEIIERAILTV